MKIEEAVTALETVHLERLTYAYGKGELIELSDPCALEFIFDTYYHKIPRSYDRPDHLNEIEELFEGWGDYGESPFDQRVDRLGHLCIEELARRRAGTHA